MAALVVGDKHALHTSGAHFTERDLLRAHGLIICAEAPAAESWVRTARRHCLSWLLHQGFRQRRETLDVEAFRTEARA
jgi:hypothetical protein